VTKSKAKAGRLSVSKGHEARLKEAIFHILAIKGPLTIYDIHKGVKAQRGLRHTRYASINSCLSGGSPGYVTYLVQISYLD